MEHCLSHQGYIRTAAEATLSGRSVHLAGPGAQAAVCVIHSLTSFVCLPALYHKIRKNTTVTKISFAIDRLMSYNYNENQEVGYDTNI